VGAIFMPFSQDFLDNLTKEHWEPEGAVSIEQMSLRRLRAAIHNHQVSFPSQVPVFACQSRANIQWRMVELYFIRNWSCADVGERYGVTLERARQLISLWVHRAALLGYLQEIPVAEAAEVPSAGKDRSIAVPAALLGREVESDSLLTATNYR
jgi:Sigma-70, region 4